MLFIATPTLGKARTEWGIRLSGHTWPVGHHRSHFGIMNLTTCEARNLGIFLALKEDADLLLYWDDDVLPRKVSATIDLIAAMDKYPEIDLIGGVYPKRGMSSEPIVVKEEGRGVWWGWQDGKVHQVYMTGTGFLMMRMSSVKKLVVPTQTQPDGDELGLYFENAEGHTDDFWFARICAEQGLRWYVHGGVECDQVDLDGRVWRFEDAQTAELVTDEPENVEHPKRVLVEAQ